MTWNNFINEIEAAIKLDIAPRHVVSSSLSSENMYIYNFKEEQFKAEYIEPVCNDAVPLARFTYKKQLDKEENLWTLNAINELNIDTEELKWAIDDNGDLICQFKCELSVLIFISMFIGMCETIEIKEQELINLKRKFYA